MILAAIGVAASCWAYFPGVMNPDSADQFRQARTLNFDDWHPPMLAWLWSLSDAVWPGPAGIFLFLTALYWLGFLLIAFYLVSINSDKYYLALILPFLPFLFNIAGTLCIDLLAFDAFLVALGLILLGAQRRRRGIVTSVAVSGLLLTGSLARHNSVVAAVPLLTLYLWPHVPDSGRIWTLARRLAVSACAVALSVAVIGWGMDRYVFRAEKAGIVNALFLWDLVGISHQIDENLVPGDWSQTEANDIVGRCYQQPEWDNLAIGDCAFVKAKLTQSGLWARGLFGQWRAAILAHPAAYAVVRLTYAKSLLWPRTIFAEPTAESFQYGFRPSPLYRLTGAIAHACRATPGLRLIFTIGFWMTASAAACIVLFWSLMRGRVGSYAAFLVAFSGGLTVWPLLAGGIAIAFRYAIWSIAATCLAVLLEAARRTTLPIGDMRPQPNLSAEALAVQTRGIAG